LKAKAQLPLFDMGEFMPYSITDSFKENEHIVLHKGDSLKFLRTIPSDIATLIITSPPYNVGKEYEKTLPLEEYLKIQEGVIEQLVRILNERGSICWQVGNYVKNRESFPLDIYYYPIFKKFNLKLRNRIVWYCSHGLNETARFSGRYETILWFTKSDNYTFNLDSVRIPSKYPGKRHFKGPNKGKPSGNPLGKNPSDIWEIVKKEWDEEVWQFPNVKSAHVEKTIHPCQYPVELVERCVLAFTNENDWVLDPYCGVGSSMIAGLKHDRRVIGVDKEAKYIEVSKERISAFFRGDLRLRELGTEILHPGSQGKVARIPDEWKNQEGM
jgi:DNA modification methylase